MIFLLLIGLALIAFGIYAFAKACYLVIKMIFVKYFANEKSIDNEYRKMFENTDEYAQHSKAVNNMFK